MLLGGRCFGQEGVIGALHQQIRKAAKQIDQLIEMGHWLQRFFIHIEATVNFDLQGMQPFERSAIMLCDEAASIGTVHVNPKAEVIENAFHRVGQGGMATGAIAITEDNVRAIAWVRILKHARGH